VLVAGTRPEFVKLHPLALALEERNIPTLLIVTNQHYSALMKDSFLEQLTWPCAIHDLGVTAKAPLPLLGEIMLRLPAVLAAGDLVVVEGDTSSVLAGALVANKAGYPLAHVEAGLRSYDLRMPEEHNRRLCDHVSDYLFAPTELDAQHLRDERCPGRTFVVGNTVLDAVRQNIHRVQGAPLPGDYILLTLHRQENVDREPFLREIIRFLGKLDVDWLFPIHPRTRDRLEAAGLLTQLAGLPRGHVVVPMDYLAFLAAMRYARVIVTDSGGVQEEATTPEIRRPVIVLRASTERVPAIEAGFSVLARPDSGVLSGLVNDLSWFRPTEQSPFGDGHAAERIVGALAEVFA
jgi:UDP-N-acetylglucosamine 2-epimerase (non-hydrolysing)